MWGPQGLPLSASGGRQRKEADPCLQQRRRFSNQHSPVQPFLCLHIWVMGAHSIAPPIWSGWGPNATICWGSVFLCYLELFQRATINQRTSLMLTHARFWGGLMFPVHNQLIPDQHWFLLSMNPPSFKALVLCVGKEMYNINSKRLHKGYFSLFFLHCLLTFFLFL